MKSVLLDHCWICKQKFGSLGIERHDHHIWPRAYGGEDGPIVSICTGHHDLLHGIAERVIAGNDYRDLETKSLDEATKQRLLLLVRYVVKAYKTFGNDPNKLIKVGLSLPGDTHRKLRELVKFKKLSQAKVLIALINEEHQRIFLVRKGNNKS